MAARPLGKTNIASLSSAFVVAPYFAWLHVALVAAQQLPVACPPETHRTYYHDSPQHRVEVYCVTPDGRPHGDAFTVEPGPDGAWRVIENGMYIDGLRTGTWWTRTLSLGAHDSTVGSYVGGNKTGTWRVYEIISNIAHVLDKRDYTQGYLATLTRRLAYYNPVTRVGGSYLDDNPAHELETFSWVERNASNAAQCVEWTDGENPGRYASRCLLSGETIDSVPLWAPPPSPPYTVIGMDVKVNDHSPPGSKAGRATHFHVVGNNTTKVGESSTDTHGRPTGVYRNSYDNGQRAVEGQYLDGVPVGKWRYFAPDGRAIDSVLVPNGTGRWRRYGVVSSSLILLEEGNLVRGERNGIWTDYAYNAQPPHFVRRERFHNGVKYGPSECDTLYAYGCAHGVYVLGAKEGEWITWENGKRIEDCNYARDIASGPCQRWVQGVRTENCVYQNGRPWGTCLRWDKQGRLTDSAMLHEGDGLWKTYSSSLVTMQGAMVHGLKGGVWESRDANGHIVLSETYFEGRLNGPYFEAPGDTIRGRYKDGLKEGTWTDVGNNGKLNNSQVFSMGMIKSSWFYTGGDTLRCTLNNSGLLACADSGPSGRGNYFNEVVETGRGAFEYRKTGVQVALSAAGDSVYLAHWSHGRLEGQERVWGVSNREARTINFDYGRPGLYNVRGMDDPGFPLAVLGGGGLTTTTPMSTQPAPARPNTSHAEPKMILTCSTGEDAGNATVSNSSGQSATRPFPAHSTGSGCAVAILNAAQDVGVRGGWVDILSIVLYGQGVRVTVAGAALKCTPSIC